MVTMTPEDLKKVLSDQGQGQQTTQPKDIVKFQSDDNVHYTKNAVQKEEVQDETDAKPMKKAAKRSILRKIRHLMPEALLSQTDQCKHDHGCFENVVRVAFKRFLIGFCLQMFIKNIAMIFKPAKLLRNL